MTTLNLVLILIIIILLIAFSQKNKKHKEQYQRLKDETDPYRKYQDIIDIKTHIRQLQEKADVDIKNKHKSADDHISSAKLEAYHIKEEAKEIRKKARAYAEKTNDKADLGIVRAQAQAKTIIQNAETRAEEIAGEALAAKRDADHLEETAKAMKNIIKGYGDEYLKPTTLLLDDLAEEYSFKEAGKELKLARERTRYLITHDGAARCDYAEARRKNIAEEFVIDAFNGKVDAILTRAKHDNYGVLEQEIKDAFRIVNHNGKAFRNARIRKQYLDARIAELHWGVRVHLLKQQEKEEQKRIREEMREEEKARREYERARKQAEKEEKMLQKAMAKLRKEFELATEEERLKYQAELNTLEQQLKEAEEKNQRALSMAQQTRRGHVYIISNIGSFGENVFKIGLTRRLEPLDRIKELGDASVPFGFDVHAMISSEDAPALEYALHKKFESRQVNKINSRKEFFRLGIKEIKEVVEEMGIEVKWTLKAEAWEYRESMAIEKRMGEVGDIVLN